MDKAEFEGIVTDHYPMGRDRILLPGPCVEARMAAPGGTSGGPVFNDSGYIFGVISTSFDGDPPIAYITTIAPIYDLNFDTKTDKGIQRLSLRKLSMLGLIAVYEKYKGSFRPLL